MVKSYYYLVAGLPELILDGGKRPVPPSEFCDDLYEQIEPEDRALVTLFRHPADNYNLASLLDKDGAPFDTFGNYGVEELEGFVRFPDDAPGYMREFLEAYKEGKMLFPGYTTEDQLSSLFYYETFNHPNNFVREWFAFDLNLRNVLVGLNCRSMAGKADLEVFSPEHRIVTRNDIAEIVIKSSAPDFSLSQSFPWIEQLVTMNETEPEALEKTVDSIRWDTLDELTVFSYFGIETLLAFCVKLRIVARWFKLNPKEGKQKLDKLVNELVSGFQVAEEF